MAYPINKAWDLTGAYIRINYATFALASAGTSTGLDFLTLCLPLPVINRLHMKGRQKLMTIGIFWLGLLYVASVLGLYAYISSKATNSIYHSCVVSGAIRFYYGYEEIAPAVASTGENRYGKSMFLGLFNTIAC